MGSGPGKVTSLFATHSSQLGTRRPGIEATFQVGVRLPMTDENQSPAHNPPLRNRVSHRSASSSCGGTAPAAAPVGHEPR